MGYDTNLRCFLYEKAYRSDNNAYTLFLMYADLLPFIPLLQGTSSLAVKNIW